MRAENLWELTTDKKHVYSRYGFLPLQKFSQRCWLMVWKDKEKEEKEKSSDKEKEKSNGKEKEEKEKSNCKVGTR